MIRKQRGDIAEHRACQYLRRHGLKLIKQNYHSPMGEIDIIMQDAEALVFVEVRYRKHRQYGGALESVDWRKQRKLKLSALHYLNSVNGHGQACRFDILCLQGELRKPDFYWIKNAF